MAILYPTLNNIERFTVPPTTGELALLKFLANSLDDTYEIYFQPYLNGDKPDVILLKQNSGVLIFEIKDWNLEGFEVYDKKRWKVKSNGALVLSPLEQVMRYKENIYSLHIDRLFELNIKNPKHFAFVSCALYFHNTDKKSLYKFCITKFNDDQDYKNHLGFYELLGNDTLNKEDLGKLINRKKLNSINPLFTNDLYLSFKRYFQPTWHQLEEGININYSTKQKDLIESADRQQKIRGVAGSGKSMILAKRAINANVRTDSKVLILTFNISLRNYLHDKLNEVREKYLWSNFEIMHYHQFIKDNCNNYNLPPPTISDYENVKLFELFKDKIKKYHCIFIDEVQDYKEEWLKIIKGYFLTEPFEYVVFADEKQNIYDRPLDEDKKSYTGVPGKYWNSLEESFRLSNKITNLANHFQNHFFSTKYEKEKITSVQLGLQFDNEHQIIKYIHKDKNQNDYFEEVFDIITSNNIHPNNVCYLSPNVNEIRKIDFSIRKSKNENTMTMFESLEIYFELLLVAYKKEKLESYSKILSAFEGSIIDLILFLSYRECPNINTNELTALEKRYNLELENIQTELIKLDNYCLDITSVQFDSRIKDYRRNKKFHFWMNPGTIKLSTIHSFKGWEIHTLILVLSEPTNQFMIVEDDHKEFISDELIYTAITRCRYNLVILNFGIEKYHNYFSTIDSIVAT